MSKSYGDADLTDLFILVGVCTVVTVTLWSHASNRGASLNLFWVGAFAIIFRCIGISTYPVLEDDYFRYLWDGWMWLEQANPYGVAPAEYFGNPLIPDAMTSVLDSINYPEIATVYGPSLQWIFGLSYWLAPGSLTPLQVIFGTADLGILCLLVYLSSPTDAQPWARRVTQFACFFYAWLPLQIKEFSITAHTDTLGVLCVLAAIALYVKRQWIAVGVLLALACGVKVFALLFVPFLLGWQWRGWLAFGLSAILIALPFGIINAWFPLGLQAMSQDWIFNSPLYLLTIELTGVGMLNHLKIGLGIIFLTVYGWQYLRWMGCWVRNDAKLAPAITQLPFHWLCGLFLLLLPVINPWYLVWWLPFVAIHSGARTWITPWVAASLSFLSYASNINLMQQSLDLYAQPLWIVLVEYGIITTAIGFDFIRTRGQASKPHSS